MALALDGVQQEQEPLACSYVVSIRSTEFGMDHGSQWLAWCKAGCSSVSVYLQHLAV